MATVVTASAVLLYVNGTLEASTTWSGTVSNIGAFEAGGFDAWSEYNACVIDDIRIFDVALSGTQISTLMSTPVSGSAALWLTKTSSGLVTVLPYYLNGSSLIQLDPGIIDE
jgi:hypothetical protein